MKTANKFMCNYPAYILDNCKIKLPHYCHHHYHNYNHHHPYVGFSLACLQKSSELVKGSNSRFQTLRAFTRTWMEKKPLSSKFDDGCFRNSWYSLVWKPASAMCLLSDSSKLFAISARSKTVKYGPWRSAFKQC